MKTANDLIHRSQTHDETVHATWSGDLDADLRAAAEDSVLNGDVVEFWGADWRVHLDVEPAILALLAEAAEVGDGDAVDMCERALAGDGVARGACLGHMRDAAAMGD